MASLTSGELIGKILLSSKKKTDHLFTDIENELDQLNRMATREATKVYDEVLSSLQTVEGTSIPLGNVGNLSLISLLMQGIDSIQSKYKSSYGRFLQDLRYKAFDLVYGKELQIEQVLKSDGIEDDRSNVNDESFQLMEMEFQKTLVKVNSILEKWKGYVYDIFYTGIAKGIPISQFRSLFFTETGNLKIGSSLSEETIGATMAFVGEQRTAWLRQKADEQGYKYCWNANPMDALTKEECIRATMAGVIPESEMSTVYGFPPRYICRCELVYTRPEWVRINQDVNKTLEKNRVALIDKLLDAPRQKSSWKRAGQTIYAKDLARLKGLRMYTDIEKRLGIVQSGKVPDYIIPSTVKKSTFPIDLSSVVKSDLSDMSKGELISFRKKVEDLISKMEPGSKEYNRLNGLLRDVLKTIKEK